MKDACRCGWCGTDPLYVRYHDEEWGVPLREERGLFEFLTLEGAQAGLSWLTILRKRENYRHAFAGFDPAIVARFTEKDVERLVNDAGIVRNRLKIAATITNASRFLDVAEKHNGFSRYLWSFVNDQPMVNERRKLEDIPASTPLSDTISKELKRSGFKFVGSTIIYALMQATGMVNDHLVSCFRYGEIAGQGAGSAR